MHILTSVNSRQWGSRIILLPITLITSTCHDILTMHSTEWMGNWRADHDIFLILTQTNSNSFS